MTTVAVTGSESGMGAAIVERLELAGYRVIGIDLPGKGAEVAGDLSTPAGRRQIVQDVLDACGGTLNGLVCNAGVDIPNPGLVLQINYLGVVEVLEGLNGALASAGRSAAVINVSNSIAITPNVPQEPVSALVEGRLDDALAGLAETPRFAYQVSKLAVARWIRGHAASEMWAGRGITMNGLCPGPVMTPLLEKDLADPHKRDAILGLPRPLGEFTPPERIGDLAEFLLSERARFIVGQLIMIDGGIETSFRGQDYPSPWVFPHRPA
jgi:NAD(P)-dependent dehydrogenase (short-subunit alcohol dehydrogenase family)